MDFGPYTTGPVFYEDYTANLFHLNELYQNTAAEVSRQLSEGFGRQIVITSGIWGGTYLIARPNGKSKRRIWRFYCMLNLPQNTPLDDHRQLEKFVALYTRTLQEAFVPHGLKLDLKMWGGVLPFSNRQRPNITMHLEDATRTIRWLRPIIAWNQATWEQSIIYDSLRLVKELKQNLDYDRGPTLTDPQEIKFMLQDVIITFLTLKNIHSPEFLEHAQPIIDDMMATFMGGLFDPEEIRSWYEKVLYNALVYGYEESLEQVYSPYGLDIRRFEDWAPEKINWVPEEAQAKLIPPIQELFRGFQTELEKEEPTRGPA